MKQEILKMLEVRESSRAEKVSLKYRKGSFTVVKPRGLQVDTEKIVEENLDWLKEKLPEARSYREKIPDRVFQEGEIFHVLGEEKEVVIERRRSNEVGENIFLAEHLVERTCLKDQLEKSLRSFAREKFEEKASKNFEKIDGSFEKIFVRDQDTRWGSCSSKDNLNFNWRLVFGPEKVLEYVVVHELVHLEVRNHSESFWTRVSEVFPEYEACSEWLESNSARLVFDD